LIQQRGGTLSNPYKMKKTATILLILVLAFVLIFGVAYLNLS